MKIAFVRNIQFTRLLKVNGHLKEFNFRKPNDKQEGLFTVDTVDDYYGSRIIFNMQKNDHSWSIIQQDLPPWVMEKEKDLGEIISHEITTSFSGIKGGN
jgi:hypothetical protein